MEKGEKMKKIISIILIVLVFSIVFTGCGKDDPVDENLDVGVKAEKDSVVITAEGSETVMSKDMKTSVDLPKDYPENIMPIYKDLFLIVSSKNADGSFSITGLTNDSVEDVAKFYNDILKEANSMMNMLDEDGYTNMGDFEGYVYTIMAENSNDEDLDYKTTVTIVLVPGELGDPADIFVEPTDANGNEKSLNDEETDGNGSSEMVIPDDKEIPDNYPEEILPFENGKETELAVVMEQNGKQMLGYMSTSEIENVFEYYKDLLIDGENYSITVDNDNDKKIISKIEEQEIQVMLHKNDEHTGEDLKYKTLIQILYCK
jgi:hypothetical protein